MVKSFHDLTGDAHRRRAVASSCYKVVQQSDEMQHSIETVKAGGLPMRWVAASVRVSKAAFADFTWEAFMAEVDC